MSEPTSKKPCCWILTRLFSVVHISAATRDCDAFSFSSECFQATSLGVSPLSAFAVVGILSGHVHFVDLTNVKQPRVVRVMRLHHNAVRHIK